MSVTSFIFANLSMFTFQHTFQIVKDDEVISSITCTIDEMPQQIAIYLDSYDLHLLKLAGSRQMGELVERGVREEIAQKYSTREIEVEYVNG